MSPRKDTLFERYLAPVFRFFVDGEELKALYESIDWDGAIARLQRPDLTYPDYYRTSNFHGIKGGYLTTDAALSYDPVTQYALPPNEIWVREAMVEAVQGHPRRILDLGCGTGSTTLMLKQAFPQAEVIGLDLSPQMLAVAEYKADLAGLQIEFRHGDAAATGFPAASFDVVSAALLFHETPPSVSQAILTECFRLLTSGGEAIALDGNQKTLRQMEWLTEIFEEPFITEYALGSLDAWMGKVGFEAVRTEDVWWVHQVTRGVKPLPVEERGLQRREALPEDPEASFGDAIPAPA